jgi:DNA polymerase III alpha subunit (gram-positive type)
MNSSLASLKTIIRSVLLEGVFEKPTTSVEDILSILEDRVLIFFDTETTGMTSLAPHALITELGAVVIDPSTGKELGRYGMKSHLSPEVEKQRNQERDDVASGRASFGGSHMSIDDVLKMTGYEDDNLPFTEEEKVLTGFVAFIKQFSSKNPVMVAHNARFDLRQINDALKRRHKLPFLPKYQVMDTKNLAERYVFPLLAVLENTRDQDPEVDRLLTQLRPEGARFRGRLGHLGAAFDVGTEHWHSAVADSMQLAKITSKIIDFFKRRGGTDLQLGRDLMRGKAKRLPTGEIKYKTKTR